ncbi:MAG: hypothetical protein LBG06_04840, partial [Deltaproteobacteria bacterium]|nr:hypothetical protein [Deltaproteobacteria bacterium]
MAGLGAVGQKARQRAATPPVPARRGARGPADASVEPQPPPPCPGRGGEPVPGDWEIFRSLTSTELSPEEREAALQPDSSDPQEEICFAPHFHPEWVPLGLIEERLKKAFPAERRRFAVPTQHNVIDSLGPWSGVEADVWSRECGMKIQLLVHVRRERVAGRGGSAFRDMIERTFRYRELQLLEILALARHPDQGTQRELDRAGFAEADRATAARYAARLSMMIEVSGIASGPGAVMLKNRLLTDYMERGARGEDLSRLDRLLAMVNLLKARVKSRLDPDRFHEARELIEEARSLGAGIV